jgi:hypothetical protein
MASYVSPKKNTEFIFYVSLTSQSSRPQFQSNPTLATGDVKVATDGGTLTNLGTLPVVTPSSSKGVKVTLSASEMNGDNILVVFSDAAGSEWDDLTVLIQTSTRQVDDLAYPNTSGRGMDVDTSGGVEVGSFQAGAITAAAIATDAIDNDALAANAITEIQSGLSTLTSANVASAVLDAVASSYNTAGTIGAKINTAASGSLGAGAVTHTVTVKDASNTPIDGAEVWITTDLAGTNVVASGATNSHGQITFMLDAGSYYEWVQHGSHNFSNPTAATVA